MSVTLCRDMADGEEAAVLAIVMAGFDEFVRPDLSFEGVAEFERSARAFVLDRPPGHRLWVAEMGNELVGMLDMRDGSHIALFFVEPGHTRRGVGGRLLEHAIDKCREVDAHLPAVTVNSSPWAVPVYRRLGFEAMDDEREHSGIRFVPMVRRL